ncbi:CAAX farnesyltransferase (FTase) subunit beta [Arachnomyces sp. PD_36]|nr:CAAX farnesyltransferase (FTase) subunit beta [Arachnomyces sp. PD_36]
MPSIPVPGKHRRRRVRFPTSNRLVSHTASENRPTKNPPKPKPKPTSRLVELPPEFQDQGSSIPDKRDMETNTPTASIAPPQDQDSHRNVPELFTQSPPIRDLLETETSKLQDSTVQECLPYLKGVASDQDGPFNGFGVPRLDWDDHIEYLYDSLEEFPGKFVGLDSSRPWMVYWALTGMSLLGEDIVQLRERVVATFAPMQNATGGFGGGHGQMSHCAPSYAVILSLAMAGGEDAYRLVNRPTMYKWLGSLKQPDGGFQVSIGGEQDVRGAYCAMVIIALLDLPLELPPEAEARKFGFNTFLDGLPEYLSRCQTYEGGISGSPGTEGHGAYAFCALACLCILGEPREMLNKYMDLPLLISWLSARQYAPEGGFSGRTNKLVDGCYSHWVGSCFPLIQAALVGTQPQLGGALPPPLYHQEGLVRYILGCCQAKMGGLRDKPGKFPDSYHTCYILAGLSNTQNDHLFTRDSSITRTLSSAFSWSDIPSPPTTTDTEKETQTQQETKDHVFDAADKLNAIHPIFVIPHAAAEDMKKWYESNPGTL